MLRITPCSSPAAAKRYFRDALTAGDYYLDKGLLKDQEVVGQWGGRAAQRLGLEGPVTADAYERLCDNLHPIRGEQLTGRMKSDRRVLFDFTFSSGKSISVVRHLLDDRRIDAALQEAVHETLVDMEKSMKARVRKGGENTDRVTGNMLWGTFLHHTSRPVDGVPDMHGHVHATVFNATWDSTESCWKAGEFVDLKRDAPFHQAAFDARLAVKLRDLGYDVERRGTGWEIAGVPESVVRKFSRRTSEIEAAARELGITDPDRKASLGATTRNRKQSQLNMDQLRGLWAKRLTPQEKQALVDVGKKARSGRIAAMDSKAMATRAIDHALRHVFERSSVVPESRVLEAALKWGVGQVDVASVVSELARRVAGKDVLVATMDGQRMATTRAVLEEEQATLDLVRRGRGQHAPLKPEHDVADAALSSEQRTAVKHVLEATSSVILVRGRAGTGKTRFMQEVVRAIAATGRTVQPVAPTAMATHEVLRKEGFHKAETVASLLASRESLQKIKGQVIWADEAGLLSTTDMLKLVRLADQAGARLILTGDTRQHRSVVRGDAMRLLETAAGLVPAELKQVRRQQRADYREAAETLSRGDLVGGFDRLDRMGAVREEGPEERPRQVADLYTESVKQGHSTLIVAPTHLEGAEVTRAIREKLRAENVIGGEDISVNRLFNRQLTEAERGDPACYVKGDIVQFHQNAHGKFRPGDRAEVVATARDSVTVHRSRDGAVTRLPLHGARAFQVFEQKPLDLAIGDRIRITYNGRSAGGKHRLNNGALYTLKGIAENGNLVLDNDWHVPRTFGHLTHGYAVTSDASQGRTVDHIIIAQSELSSAASNIQQFYTSVTRGRERVTIVTDDKTRLMQSVARDNSRMSATELARLATSPPGRGRASRQHTGMWMAKENTRRLKAEVNRSLRDQRHRDRDRGRRRSGDWEPSRER